MDLSPTTTVSTPVRDKPWLASAHGVDSTRSVTLDVADASFTALKETLDDGRILIPSGVAVYDQGDGTFVVATGVTTPAFGHLFEDVVFGSTAVVAGASVQWHGVFVEAQVPGTFTVADNAAPHALYV